MTDEQIEAAARSDPDSQPLTPADFARMKRTPQVKIIRRALGLRQEDFAARWQLLSQTDASLHLQLFPRIERVVERGVDHIEDAPHVARTNGDTLFESIDR